MSKRVSVEFNTNGCSVVRIDAPQISKSLFEGIAFEWCVGARPSDLEPHQAHALAARLETLACQLTGAAYAVEHQRIEAHGGDVPRHAANCECRACRLDRISFCSITPPPEPTEVGPMIERVQEGIDFVVIPMSPEAEEAAEAKRTEEWKAALNKATSGARQMKARSPGTITYGAPGVAPLPAVPAAVADGVVHMKYWVAQEDEGWGVDGKKRGGN